jgi:hypothetical protein
MNAPGCFGAASVFSHDSKTCKACPQFNQCADLSLERLQSISGTVNVTDLMRKHQRAQQRASIDRAAQQEEEEVKNGRVIQRAKPIGQIQRKSTVEKVAFEIDPETQTAIANIGNKKANAFALTLCKNMTVDQIRADFRAGLNPFKSPNWLHTVGNMLCGDPFTKAQLKVQFMTEFNWSDGTAGSHVSIAVALVTGIGIAMEHQGSFMLSPAQQVHD